MTDAEWLAADDPEQMLTAVGTSFSDRKMLLFACGSFRLVAPRLPANVLATADTFEKVADGLVGAAQRKSVLRNLAAALGGDPVGVAAFAYGLVPFGAKLLGRQAIAVARAVEAIGPSVMSDPSRVTVSSRHVGQAALLREIHGPAVDRPRFEPAWRTPTTDALARTVYERQAYDRLPVLADALEAAGCTDATMLNHCRDTTLSHAKGCWVVDLVIGLE
jgi:hypothetical protein